MQIPSAPAPRYFYWIAYGAIPFLLLCTYLGATAHFGETRPSAPVAACVEAVAHSSGMRINPCAELDTTQVVDSRTGAAPRSDDAGIWVMCTDDNAAVCDALVAMGYRGDPTDGAEKLAVRYGDYVKAVAASSAA